MSTARIGIIGGSGLYRLLDPTTSESRRVETPYGPALVTLGEFAGRDVAFLTRHGADHSVAPHLIGYRANIWALAAVGVTAIVSSSAVGGLIAAYPPGTLVLTDQFIDRTDGRAGTFFDRGSVQHLAAADPFDPVLHRLAADALSAEGADFVATGTAVVIQGPRFSTRAESRMHAASGGHIINMTMCPEVPLAGELGIGTVNLSFVTDADAGVVPADLASGAVDDDAVSHRLVLDRLAAAQPRIIAAIEAIIRAIPRDYAAPVLIPPDEVAAVLAREPIAVRT